ncbi:unnamed protein product, partial [Prorocentrum cordatum]
AAQVPAQAEKAKSAATEALARAEGTTAAPAAADTSQGTANQPKFKATWNEAPFQGLDEPEREKTERQGLRLAHTQLQERQNTLSAKEADTQVMLEKAATVRKEVDDRLAKERKTAEGQAAPGGGRGEGAAGGDTAPGAASSAEAGAAAAAAPAAKAEAKRREQEQIELEAVKLPSTKFAAQRAALEEQKATVGKSMGKGEGNGNREGPCWGYLLKSSCDFIGARETRVVDSQFKSRDKKAKGAGYDFLANHARAKKERVSAAMIHRSWERGERLLALRHFPVQNAFTKSADLKLRAQGHAALDGFQ